MLTWTPSDVDVAPRVSRRSLFRGACGLGAAALLSSCDSSTPEETRDDDAPKRVVALSTGHLDYCLALGTVPVGLAVVAPDATNSTGIPRFIRDAFGDKYDLDAIQIVGERTSPSPEKIAALQPDLILTNKRNDKSLNDQLSRMATTVQTTGGSEAFKADLAIVADALKQPRAGEKLLADYENRAREWGRTRGDSATISLVRARGDQYLYFGELALASIVGTDAGLTRPPAQRFTDVASRPLSPEEVGMLDADWLFYSFPKASRSLTESALWQKLPVVERGHAFEVDVDPWFVNASTVAAERVLSDMQKFMTK
ncbi:iron-siderophore ABC transporter substrate-binding protein [Tsukamurella sp. 1534]|uniref:ABC transporter substrate-binding protein n=1 Tax=Tsukamurella sp. 1534 TaxID=1151061 RepID=UPI0002EE4593|nr:iron-siderophore ABC transporter substrate-binding protein [Tsukamurella sp. 1534]